MLSFTVIVALSALVALTQAIPYEGKREHDTCHIHYHTTTWSPANATTPLPTGTATFTGIRTSPSSASSSTSFSSATPACNASAGLPASFYIYDSVAWLAAKLPVGANGSVDLTEVSDVSEATIFYIANTTVAGYSDMDQIAFDHTDPATGNVTTYTSWVYVPGEFGGPLTFISTNVNSTDLWNDAWFPVSGYQSYLTCILVPMAFLNKYIEVPGSCGGTIWLDRQVDSGCTALELTVSPAIS